MTTGNLMWNATALVESRILWYDSINM